MLTYLGILFCGRISWVPTGCLYISFILGSCCQSPYSVHTTVRSFRQTTLCVHFQQGFPILPRFFSVMVFA